MNSLFTVVVLGFLLICAIATCLTRKLHSRALRTWPTAC